MNLGTIEPGQTVKLTGTLQVKETDMGTAPLANTFTATGGSARDSETVSVAVEPVINDFTVTKTETSNPTSDGAYNPGDTVRWAVNVVNTGNQTLKNGTLSDKLTGATVDNASIATLPIKASTSRNVSFVTNETDSDVGDMRNTVSVTANGVTKEATSGTFRVNRASLDVTVTIANTGTGINGAYTTGDDIIYTIKVTNDGTSTVNNINVGASLGSVEG